MQGPASAQYFDIKDIPNSNPALDRSVSGVMPVVKQGNQQAVLSYTDTNHGNPNMAQIPPSPRSGGKTNYDEIPYEGRPAAPAHHTAPAGNGTYASFPIEDSKKAAAAPTPKIQQIPQPHVHTAPAGNNNYASFMPNTPAPTHTAPVSPGRPTTAAPSNGNYQDFMQASAASGTQTAPAGAYHQAPGTQARQTASLTQAQTGNYANFGGLGTPAGAPGSVVQLSAHSGTGTGTAPSGPTGNYMNFAAAAAPAHSTAPAALENRNPAPIQYQHQGPVQSNSHYFSFDPAAAAAPAPSPVAPTPYESGQFLESLPQSTSPSLARPMLSSQLPSQRAAAAQADSVAAKKAGGSHSTGGLAAASQGSLFDVSALVDAKKGGKDKDKGSDKKKSKEKEKEKEKEKSKSKEKEKSKSKKK